MKKNAYKQITETGPEPGEYLERNSHTPLYQQLETILTSRIMRGEYAGRRLPTVRETAAAFETSVSTVVKAYDSLRRQGLISGTVGRGTFVTTTQEELGRHNREVQLRSFIRHALEEALSFGFSIDEFAEEVERFLTLKRREIAETKLVFIECNREQLRYFTDHLELDPSISRIPLLLSDLQDGIKIGTGHAVTAIRESDLILTSFYHIREVTELVHGWNKPIIGINLEPEIQTIVETAKIPSDAIVGLAAGSDRFLQIVKDELNRLNLHFSSIVTTTSTREEDIQELVDHCSVLLVSPRQKELVARCAGLEKKVIEFVFTPDRTSINNIKVAVMELHSR